jgi:hypothetical protein
MTISVSEFRDLAHSCDIIRSVEATHPNVGIPMVFTKLCDLADLGLMLLAPRGYCKTDLLRGIQSSLLHRPSHEINVQTIASLSKSPKMLQKFNEGNLTVINPDFSAPNKYSRGLTLSLFSILLTDHAYGYNTQTGTFQITKCHCSFLSAVQPIIYSKMTESPEWEAVHKDRYIRYLILFPQPYKPRLYPPNPHRPPTLDQPLPLPKNLEIDSMLQDSSEYRSLEEVLVMQTSRSRGPLYLKRLLYASANLNGRKTPTLADVKFLHLCLPNLEFERFLSLRERAGESPAFLYASCHCYADLVLNRKLSRRDFLQKYSLSKRRRRGYENRTTTLSESLDPLHDAGIIRGKFGDSQGIEINPAWFDRYFQPQLDFVNHVGATQILLGNEK